MSPPDDTAITEAKQFVRDRGLTQDDVRIYKRDKSIDVEEVK